MKRIATILALSLLPIVSIQPAEAKVCTYKTRQYKNTWSKAYTQYKYKTYRSCK